jgi:hypothetical protein
MSNRYAGLELPRLSLGWDVLPFVEDRLDIRLTPEQTRRIFDLYSVDETGRRVYRRAAIRRPKGIGKSPEGGYLAFAELAGPVIFRGFDASGVPVGMPHPNPLVQLAAVSMDQTDNVMVWLLDTLADNRSRLTDLKLEVGRNSITRRARRQASATTGGRPGVLEIVTAEANSREGARGTFAVLDQSESWTTGNGGRRLADVLRRNAAKVGGWTFELQNAPEPGDASVADLTARAAEKRTPGVYFDAGPPVPEVPDLSNIPALLAALEIAYADAALRQVGTNDDGAPIFDGWVDLVRLAEDINDPDTDPSDARRYYLNQVTPRSERAYDRGLWIAGAEGRSLDQLDEETVVVGFDGSMFDDATALVVAGVVSGTMTLAGLWEKPEHADDTWQVPVDEVDAVVEELVDRYDVWRLYADPFRWQSSMSRWDGLRRKEFVASWSTARLKQTGYACRNFAAEIRAGDIGPAPDEHELTRHMGNAVRRYVNSRDDKGARLWTLAKPSPLLKIDGAMAATLAAEARRDALTAGVGAKKRVMRAAGF